MLKINKGYCRFHITLAYQYKFIEKYKDKLYIEYLVDKLSEQLRETIITIEKPSLRYFSSMTKFIPYENALNKVSHTKINISDLY